MLRNSLEVATKTYTKRDEEQGRTGMGKYEGILKAAEVRALKQ